ncbi:MAG: DUF1667 domain-containing protein [Clostridia bacterium]|nr:DUF1667 domain-containing protein [Clostridia bacterium]
MEKKELTCVVCPFGCLLEVEVDDNNDVTSVKGNTCNRGVKYAQTEIKDPRRNICSTVKVTGSKDTYIVPVKTSSEIPKDKIFDCMEQINNATIPVPVHIGDIVIKNILDTGVDILATNNVLE